MAQVLGADSGEEKIVVGSKGNFWIWSRESGWDLTHPPTPDSEPCQPRLHLNCEISNVTIDPHKTALLVIDMQNYSMCEALVPFPFPKAFQVEDRILRYAIPAARKAGIQVIWLNWGLTEQDLEAMPPGPRRVFGLQARHEAVDYGIAHGSSTANGKPEFSHCGERLTAIGLGADLGTIVLADGSSVHAGRALMRDTWNAALHDPSLVAFEHGQETLRRDVLIYKNRNSGLWDEHSDCLQYLMNQGTRTLLFTGVNTDQCVLSTLVDAHSRGFDTILLRDGCATDSPSYAQQSVEFNCCRNLGFLSTCEALATAVEIQGPYI